MNIVQTRENISVAISNLELPEVTRVMCLCLLLVPFLLALFYSWRSRNVHYWRDRGVPTASGGHWLFGHYKDILFVNKHLATLFDEVYLEMIGAFVYNILVPDNDGPIQVEIISGNHLNHVPSSSEATSVIPYFQQYEYPKAPVVGFLKMSEPFLMIKDPELLKSIISTDFSHFYKNEISIDKKIDMLFGNNPFAQSGPEWRDARANATPFLTLARLRSYYPSFLRVGDALVCHIEDTLKMKGGLAEFEAQQLIGTYTTDAVSNAVFGIQNNSFKEQGSVFAQITRNIFKSFATDNIRYIAIFPTICALLRLRFGTKEVEKVLLKIAAKIMCDKQESNTNTGHDIFQQIVVAKQNGKGDVYTDERVAGIMFAFLMDGYETSSIFMTYTVFELAWNKHVQDKLREEVKDLITRTEGEYTIDDIESLKYMDMVFSESLRRHPPIPTMTKICTSDYTVNLKGLSDTFTIEKGTLIAISAGSLHMDPAHYPEPKKFLPERFTEEEVNKRHKFVYLPFNEGPRKCIGQRFGMLQSKVMMIKLLSRFSIAPSPRSEYVPPLDPACFPLLRPLGGAWVLLRKLDM